MAAQNFDIFSSLKDEAFLAILLYTGPLPSDIVRLSMASPFARNRLSTDSFCRKFLSLYLNVTTLAERKISWCEELKKWWKLRNELFHCKLDIQGREMKEICDAAGKSTYKIALRSNGIVRLSHALPMAPRTRVLLTNFFNEFPQEGMIFQPPGTFPFLPLSGCPSMYYEVKIAKSVPRFGGPVIGYAIPSLCSALPGLLPGSFGVSLSQLIGLNGNYRIPSPRGETFALRKGDVFGVGLIHKLTPELTILVERWNPNDFKLAHHADFAVFYVTFNGKLIYSTVGESHFHIVPTIVLTTYGDVVDVNFGAETSPSDIFSANGFEILKTCNENLPPVRFYKSTWKYDPLEASHFFETDLSTKVKGWEILDRGSKALNQPKDYWCSLHDLNQFVPAASNELILFRFIGIAVHYQNLRDFLSHFVLPQWAKITNLFAKIFETVHLYELKEAELPQDQVISFLQDETDLQSFVDAEDTRQWILDFIRREMNYFEREIGLQLVSLLKAGFIPREYQNTLCFHLIAHDTTIFPKERYDGLLTLIDALIDASDTIGYFQCIFSEAIKLLFRPNSNDYTRQGYQGVFSAALSFRRLGLLPQNDQALTKEQFSEIYESLNDDERRELCGSALHLLVGSCHFFDETNWPSSIDTPWVPTTSVEFIYAALTSLFNQRNKARNCDAPCTRDEILTIVGRAYNLLCFVEDPESYLETVDEESLRMSLPDSYEHPFNELAKYMGSPFDFYTECDTETFSEVVQLVHEYWDAHCSVASFWFGEEVLVDTMCSSEHFPNLSPEVLLEFKRTSNNFSLRPYLIYGGIITALLVGSAIAFRSVKRILSKK